jgi:hypothetical protein
MELRLKHKEVLRRVAEQSEASGATASLLMEKDVLVKR